MHARKLPKWLRRRIGYSAKVGYALNLDQLGAPSNLKRRTSLSFDVDAVDPFHRIGAKNTIPVGAGHAVLFCALEFMMDASICGAVITVGVERLARRADTSLHLGVVVKVCGTIAGGLFLLLLLT